MAPRLAALGLFWWSSADPARAQSPYEIWRLAKFTPAELADPSICGGLADPDHDGLSNFLEYAFHQEPKVADLPGDPRFSLEAGVPALTHTEALGATDLAFFTQISTDLIAWKTGPFVEWVSTIPTSPETREVTYRKAGGAPGGPRSFLRLLVMEKGTDANFNGVPDDWELSQFGERTLTLAGDFDADGVPDDRDARPADPGIGVLAITITTPSAGSTVP